MLKVLKLILEIIKNIKIKMGCCYESQCSINANEIDTNDEENNVNRLYNETFKDSEVDE
jgi:hypothetical protein